MNRRESADLDRHITGNYGEDQFAATITDAGPDDAPQGCSHPACNMDAAPYSDLCAYHLERNVFERIARSNRAMWAAMDETLPKPVRLAALDVWLPKGGA